MCIIALEKRRLSAVTTLTLELATTHHIIPQDKQHLDQPHANDNEANHRSTNQRHNQCRRPLQYEGKPYSNQTSATPNVKDLYDIRRPEENTDQHTPIHRVKRNLASAWQGLGKPR